MKLLAVSAVSGDVRPHAAAEMRRVAELQEAGLIERFFLVEGRGGAVLLLEAASGEHARRELDSLPMTQAGVLTWELTELVERPPPEADR